MVRREFFKRLSLFAAVAVQPKVALELLEGFAKRPIYTWKTIGATIRIPLHYGANRVRMTSLLNEKLTKAQHDLADDLAKNIFARSSLWEHLKRRR